MQPQTNRNFESNRILAGVGALLAAVGSFIPFSGQVGIVHVVGIILVLVAMRGLSDDYKDFSIYRNTVNGFIFNIIGSAVFIATFVIIIHAFTVGFLFARPMVGIIEILTGIAASAVGFIFLVLSALSYRRAFDTVAGKSGETLLKTGGLLLLIGSVLTIVFVGFFLMFVAWLLLAIGFFQMRLPVSANTYPSVSQTPIPTSSGNGQVKYCSFCGAENRLEASFCTHCGRRLEPAPANRSTQSTTTTT
jgi:uncharacterized membrane protein